MIIQSYQDLIFYVEMFRNGGIDLLVIEGHGGLAKSRIVEETLKEVDHLRILSHVTPLRLYIEAYLNKDKFLVFDDVSLLLENENNLALLKMLCSTEEQKEISWFSTSPILESNGIPSKFETRSKAIVITNDFNELTKSISALKDRGFLLEFRPTTDEILKKMLEILPDIYKDLTMEEKRQVYDLLAKYSNLCNEMSIRTLIKSCALFRECKNRGIDWKSILLSIIELNPKLILLDKILREYEKESDRVSAWEKEGYSKRSYYDHKVKLNAKLQAPIENLHQTSLSTTPCISALSN